MKRVMVVILTVAMAACFAACGPTPEELELTKQLYENVQAVQKQNETIDQLLDNSDEMFDELDKEVEDILGMSLDDALDAKEEGKTLDEKKQEMDEPEAQTIDPETLADYKWEYSGIDITPGASADKIPLIKSTTLRFYKDGTFDDGNYDGTYELKEDQIILSYKLFGSRHAFTASINQKLELTLITDDSKIAFYFQGVLVSEK